MYGRATHYATIDAIEKIEVSQLVDSNTTDDGGASVCSWRFEPSHAHEGDATGEGVYAPVYLEVEACL